MLPSLTLSLFDVFLLPLLFHSILHTFFPHFCVYSLFLTVLWFLSLSVHFHRMHSLHPTFCYPPFSYSIKPCLSLSLFILRGVPDPIHSFLFKTVDPLLAITLHAPLSLNIPSPCPPTTLTFPPPPLLFYPLSLSLALLPLLSRSNLSPEGSDWQASGGLVKGEFLIGGEGDEKDKASWTCPVCTAKKHSL